MLDDDGLPLSANARMALDVLVNQVKEIAPASGCHRVRAGSGPQSRSGGEVAFLHPGICPIRATALVATAPDPTVFSTGREFAAWHDP